ncbi:hypothetical protein H4R33_003445 [Dimargaris cristalligena]|uniref:Uncharacterized protein n=1 Tax=Dimargaris cristalligena TaxID=215637 RepID=A0A4V1J5F5_9FUNG|nr:hypothetical protein H4R33_003445 [Dimargaris cristalligena]RKP38879.1 hypothetical protein BJ085DRAFT_33257 [Dimargaris cristalligena]|eukprot:RKP38879.1 hypothetical protein BJ085DRAFT_33257 [Dimargaris cristalligena]
MPLEILSTVSYYRGTIGLLLLLSSESLGQPMQEESPDLSSSGSRLRLGITTTRAFPFIKITKEKSQTPALPFDQTSNLSRTSSLSIISDRFSESQANLHVESNHLSHLNQLINDYLAWPGLKDKMSESEYLVVSAKRQNALNMASQGAYVLVTIEPDMVQLTRRQGKSPMGPYRGNRSPTPAMLSHPLNEGEGEGEGEYGDEDEDEDGYSSDNEADYINEYGAAVDDEDDWGGIQFGPQQYTQPFRRPVRPFKGSRSNRNSQILSDWSGMDELGDPIDFDSFRRLLASQHRRPSLRPIHSGEVLHAGPEEESDTDSKDDVVSINDFVKRAQAQRTPSLNNPPPQLHPTYQLQLPFYFSSTASSSSTDGNPIQIINNEGLVHPQTCEYKVRGTRFRIKVQEDGRFPDMTRSNDQFQWLQSRYRGGFFLLNPHDKLSMEIINGLNQHFCLDIGYY